MQRTSKTRRWLYRLGAVALGVGLALILAELAVRLFDLGPTLQVVHREVFQLADDPELVYELRPGARAPGIAISSAGLRDREFSRAKPAGVFRIVAIGDSVTFGPPGYQELAWPRQLEGLLNGNPASDRRYEVLNLGVTGYGIAQVAARLRTLGLSFEPDLIVYGYVLNDPQEQSVEAAALRDLRDAEERRFLGAPAGLARPLGHSRLFLLVRHLWRRTAAADDAPAATRRHVDPGYVAIGRGDTRGRYFRDLHTSEPSTERLRRGFDELQRLAGDRPLVVMIFPLLLDPRLTDYPLTDVHERVASAAREHGFEVLDLLPVYRSVATQPGSPTLADDLMHPSPFGYRVAAQALARWLTERGLLPTQDPIAAPSVP